MSDPLRTDSSRALDAAPDGDRDAKIEQLLLLGLDHYFSAEYEQAIDVWTRALFLDRSHAKARAYIERARSALAERLRESEEMLHDGVAAFQQGDAGEARRLLQTALSRGPASDEALALLNRLDWLEQGAALPPSTTSRVGRRVGAAPGVALARRGIRASVVVCVLGFAAAVAAITVVATQLDWRSLLLPPAATSPAVASPTDAALPLPRRGEMALTRARAFAASGHLREALAALEAVQPTDPQKTEADQLRARIQRELIALTSIGASAAPGGRKNDGRLP